MQITSEKNPKIQRVIRLREKARERRDHRLFVIEGVRELTLALKSGYHVRMVFCCASLVEKGVLNDLKIKSGKADWYEISDKVYEKIAVRESTEGIIAIAEMRDLYLDKLKLTANPLVLVIEGIEKPGNLGALLRTADAAGLHAVILCDPNLDIYSPNVIRSSLGCLFTRQIAVCNPEEAISWLRKHKLKIFAATPRGAKEYFEADFSQPASIVVGSEAHGLSQQWLENSDENIKIPMRGVIDSLNVSVSAAVILFEAVRQRLVT